MQHNLNGVEDEFKITYSKGNFNGNSNYTKRYITNGQLGNPKAHAQINFVNDTIIGAFEISIDKIKIKGKTNKQGFLDGTVLLKYHIKNDSIIETRKYQDGFLLEIEKRNASTNELLVKLIYEDIIKKLSQIKKQEDNLDFKISDKFFGLEFNVGYQNFDNRLIEQFDGNKILQKYLSLFDSIHNNNTSENTKKSIFKFTRRFKYMYNTEEDSLVSHLSKENNILNDSINEILNSPNVVFRAESSDTLFKQYQVLKHVKSKSDTLQKVFEKITTGFFDYRSRNQFYYNGIPGLAEFDTIKYFLKGDTISLPFNFNHRITSSDNIIYQISNYLQALQEKANSTMSNLSKSLKIYENQEIIDSLDRVLSSLQSSINEKYSEASNFKDIENSKVSFSIKVYHSLHERILSGIKKKYINNSLSQEKMIELGNTLICYYAFLDSNKAYLDRIDNMHKYWNDSLFTVYRDNPFDFRKLQTKILEGVQNASNILLNHYANQLLNAKTCEQINNELNKIILLNNRVEFLVKNMELDIVQKLNRALRRERVPSRIERLLEL